MINVIGDSHTVLFIGYYHADPIWEEFKPNATDRLRHFNTYPLPNIRAYNMYCGEGNPVEKRFFDLLQYLPKEEPVVISAGEIDCRGPVLNVSYRTGRSIEDVTGECASRYLTAIKYLRNEGWNAIMYQPNPNHYVEYDISQEQGFHLPENLSTIEWCKLKTRAVQTFNQVTRDSGFPIVSLADWIFENDLMNDASYWRDTCHLNIEAVKPQLIIEFAKIGLEISFEERT